MEEARDEVYCHLIARKAVARAALHMGIETMSREALDTLADVLISYLSRIGQSLAVGVEASGRSSAHCNVLDCVKAIEMNTESAVLRVYGVDASQSASGTNGVADGISHSASRPPTQQEMMADQMNRSWKGLAAFCFGRNWNAPQTSSKTDSARPAGGKVGPSSVTEETIRTHGWNAPYPEEIQDFPIVEGASNNMMATANPHTLPPEVADSFHTTDAAVQKAGKGEPQVEKPEIPDTMLLREWGTKPKKIGVQASNRATSNVTVNTTATNNEAATAGEKRKASESPVPPGEEQPPAKRSKTDSATTGVIGHSTTSGRKAPRGLPGFFPLFPLSAGDTRTVVALNDPAATTITQDSNSDVPAKRASDQKDSATSTAGSHLQVRSALVSLGGASSASWRDDKEYTWGAMKDLRVPSGRAQDAVASAAATVSDTNATNNPAAAASQIIVPLGRASGSRVSRILEGSMENTIT